MPLLGSGPLSLLDAVRLVAERRGEPGDRAYAVLIEAALAGTITATGCRHCSAHRDLAQYFAHPMLAEREAVPPEAWGAGISLSRSQVGRYDLVRFARMDIERWLAAAVEQLSASVAKPEAAKTDEIPSGIRTNRAKAAEEACRKWLAGLKERPANKDAAFEQAKVAVAREGPLSRKAFDRVWPSATPDGWKRAGRRRG